MFVRFWGVGERAFWIDEAWVALDVTNQSFSELLGNAQTPLPPLFAVTVKLTSYLLPRPETALRLLPMVCGVALLPMLYLVLRILRVPRWSSLAAVTLCASSPLLVIWSRELKQYQVEAFLSAVLAYLVFRLRRDGWASTQRILIAGIIAICLFGPWFGYGLIFPAAALLGILIVLRPLHANRRMMVLTGLSGAVVLGISVLVLLNSFAAGQASDSVLRNFMGQWFVNPTSLYSWARAAGYGAATVVTMFLPFFEFLSIGKIGTVLVASIFGLFVLMGLWRWPIKSRNEMVLWTVAPWILLLAAAIAQRYPFGATRMMCFCAVTVIPAFVMGLLRVCRKLSRLVLGSPRAGFWAAFAVVVLPVFYMVRMPLTQEYWVTHDFRKVTKVLKEKLLRDEAVVVTAFANYPVKFYSHGWGEDFYYAPCANSRPVPGYDYAGFARKFLEKDNDKWWLLTLNYALNREPDIPRKYLIKQGTALGYNFELITEGGCDRFGKAQLFSAKKK